ncbi:MAG: glycosyltransferase family 39 protein [Actinomycetota bacterium]
MRAAQARSAALDTVAWGPLIGLGIAVAAGLLAVANRYGYHRDELYFLEAGDHLAWGYPDQPPYVALMARAMDAIAEGSLVALRTPSAITIALLTLVTGLVARELGADRLGQTLAAAVMATGGVALGSGHLLSTTPPSLLTWAVVTWLVLRGLRTGHGPLWLLAGGAAGLGLQANSNVVFLLAAILAGLLLAGSRATLRTWWPWAGAALAVGLWAPYLLWQAREGWPQLEVSASITAGESGTSEPRELFLPLQLVMLNPFMAPVWIAGGVRLLRDPALAWCRGLGWCWPLLAAVFLVTGGKPYYLSGTMPLLLGAGAPLAITWARQARSRAVVLVVGVALGLPAVFVTWPLVPPDRFADSLAAANYDLGEQIGWPDLVAQVAAVVERQDGPVALLASNYGEAGALDRYGDGYSLPQAHSGHMGYWHWGPPPDDADIVVAVGFDRATLARAFDEVSPAGRVDNGLGVDNDEQGAPIWVCRGLRQPWGDLWADFRDL